MKYNVIIRKCDDVQKAHQIEQELASWSGMTVEKVYRIIADGPLCVLKDASEKDALAAVKRFEALGAAVLMSSEQIKSSISVNAPDDLDEPPGRLLTEKEFVGKLIQRSDILSLDKDNRLRKFELVSLIMGVGCGIFLSTRELDVMMPDFIENIPQTQITLNREPVVDVRRENAIQRPVDLKSKSELKNLKKTSCNGSSSQKGGGDIRARATTKGILGIISGQIKGKTVASADLFAKGGYCTDIDAILAGVGGLKSSGDAGVGRKGITGIGFGKGYGSGFGEGGGGIEDVFNNLISSGSGSDLTLKSRQVKIAVDIPFVKGHGIAGGRSKTEIMQVVMQNIRALRHAYNKRLHQKPGLSGKVTVKFGIDDFGRVLFVQVLESTMSDIEIESAIAERIKRWVFAKIDKPGDITEVVYPFVFSL